MISDPDLIRPELLHELFEATAAAHGERTAVVCGQTTLTYRELNRRAERLAGHLAQLGVGRGDCVGLWLPRSAEVYVGLLAILKAGAAYVPIDPGYPVERVEFILSDSKCKALLTHSRSTGLARFFSGQVVTLDTPPAELGESRNSPPDRCRPSPTELAYLIYTSGSTGKPKGVEIEHRSACHLVRAEGRIFHVQATDRVYQGFSIAFDASVEEVWLAFHSGAALVVGTEEMQQAGPDLSRLLTEAGVTVVSCVPTLLAILDQDLPTVRLLILGGEAFSDSLARRWCRPGRRVVNTYGPTEATVIATYSDCDPAKPVTIGRPLPNYSAYILNDRLEEVPQGEPGELCLGGIGLARGYVGREDLTRERFIEWSGERASTTERLYRTGDLARWNPSGEIEFLGRIDTQVKIRGFRVELSEIESVLLSLPNIQAAAVSLREDTPGIQNLVGYVVTRGTVPWEEHRCREELKQHLPAYMVPALLEQVQELPTLPSGKVDRTRLPAPAARGQRQTDSNAKPRTELEGRISQVWERLFAPATVSINDNFFLDLGGHSLLAARMVSELRKQPGLEQLSMLDVYQHPSISGLAAELEVRNAATRPPDAPSQQNEVAPEVPFWRHFCCGTAQLLSLIIILTFFAAQWLAPYVVYTFMVEDGYESLESIIAALASLVVLYPALVFVPVAVKWLVIGRYRAGSHPLWGSYYFRWWFVTTVEAAVPVGYLAGTPLLNIYLRLMGAKIGSNVHLDGDSFVIYDLVQIGDNSTINVDSHLPGYTISGNQMHLGRIEIGRDCFVGTRSAIGIDTKLEDGAALEDLSLLPRGGTIPAGETWLGSPARPVPQPGKGAATNASRIQASLARRFAFGVLHGIGLLIFPILVSCAIFPGMVLMNYLNFIDPYYWYLCLAPMVALSFVGLLCLEIAGLKWLLLGRVKAGGCQLHSFAYLRRWFVDQTMDLSLDVVGPLYGSIYLVPWYRLLGAKVGKRAEVSTASFISPDLLEIGEESFIADSVSLGAPRVSRGYLSIGPNRIGKRSFIGNSAMLPPGTVIGDNCLIGCLSAPPANPADALREGTSWMGSPAIFLPQRQQTGDFPVESTFNPPFNLRFQRAAIEFVRVITPSTCFIILLSLLFSVILLLRDELSVLDTLLLFPFLYFATGLAAALLTIIAKWLLVGRYQPCEKPLWNNFVWRNELINALHEHVAEPFLIGALTGTPFICWYFRMLGAHIGRKVFMETTDFSEFDLVRIGDNVTLNADCTIQTHLFEDRVMKMSTIYIASNANVGAGSLVLYDTKMETNSELGDLSLLMKGEDLPAGTAWEGIPARPRIAVTARPATQETTHESGAPSAT